MRILITNDDGVHAPGLHAGWRALAAAGHEVFVCVPDRERSACGHQITMHEPLRVRSVNTADGICWTTTGTPADCIPMALLQLMKAPPDLVVSGINLGPNLGDDVHYSGTVAGAMEGIFNNIPSLAISLVTHQDPNWDVAARFLVDFVPRIAGLELPRDTFLNVNVPNLPTGEIKGVRVTSQGTRRYRGDLVKYEAPNVGTYYWRGGEVVDRAEREDADVHVIKQGYISVTPLHVDLTSFSAMEKLKGLF